LKNKLLLKVLDVTHIIKLKWKYLKQQFKSIYNRHCVETMLIMNPLSGKSI